ncbi:MAG: DUF3108 domain-containing protein [Pseudomonadota bacterium]
MRLPEEFHPALTARHPGQSMLTLCMLLIGSEAWAETIHSRYDVRVIGVKVGEMAMASSETHNRYSTRARFATTGAVSTISNASFDISTKGRITGRGYVPQSYREVTNEGRHSTNVKISYSSGIATKVTGDTGGRVAPVDPSKMRDALDPLTTLYLALRAQPASKACSLNTDVYDGQRHARLTLTEQEYTAGGVRCAGFYRRIAGYSSSSKKNTRVPVSVTYSTQGDMLYAQLVTVDTRYGKVTLHRR